MVNDDLPEEYRHFKRTRLPAVEPEEGRKKLAALPGSRTPSRARMDGIRISQGAERHTIKIGVGW